MYDAIFILLVNTKFIYYVFCDYAVQDKKIKLRVK
ncbi:hypothetical protein AKUH4B114J_00580 [Apilactobacillus kunkeei]|nr:hypothetical protein AKUH3B101X_00570 [Apilactobacillus kunkeei]CAI2550849.1 hypothetical protein AKUH3B203M01_00990 [Apilactobacillus kunkeei]CAI2551081.1 hypothetical protein AKUH4B210M_00570 [Apilactobacillus kunkeei]CAI2551087.1 hypothetical protein AKUH3B203M_00500 [Apilactobacillus kunkeei]CAI2551121.1 hypothetical protein AKUH3B202M_00570 [Apilactobacillus kunkeei]